MTDPIAGQRHMLFLIPNYDKSNADDPNGSPLSYIKLGSSESTSDLSTAKKRGDDLLEAAGVTTTSYARFFIDDQRQAACEDATDSDAVGYRHGTHYDEVHTDELAATLEDPATTYYRSDAKDTFTTSTATALSAQLVGDGSQVYARGGWRDHTDGNRIVTVRGDRVDLVVGNYKRVVFGRVSGFSGQGANVGVSSYESSGGHLFERTSADIVQHYAIERVKEVDVDGSTYWKLVERANNADCVFRYSGDHTEHHNGPVRKTTIGVDASSVTDNPEMSVSHNFGRAETTIDARSVTQQLEVEKFQSATYGSKATWSENMAAVTVHRARGKALNDTFTFKEEIYARFITETSLFGARFHFTAGAAKLDDFVGAYQVSSGVRMKAHAGARIRVHYGTRSRWYAGLWWRQTTGPSLVADLGIYTNMYILNFWKPPPVDTVYFLGDTQFELSRSDSDVMSSKAYTMFMES